MNYYVYVIYNHRNNKIYIGQTINLVKRLKQHNDSSFKKFTSRYSGEWVLVHKESLASRSEAVVREKQLKSYQGRKFIKSKIINSWYPPAGGGRASTNNL
ncbi:MAG: GIY-YIG nuclease family protein [Candidatus Pacebacteria bacterium]|nr:GIY-YIG nuclease family protein [Candidatus Paceibacterota bacterium]